MKKKRYILSEKAYSLNFPFVAQYGIKTKNFPRHSHDFNELFIVTKGTALHRIGKTCQRIEQGDVFLIKNKELEHGFEQPEHLELFNFMFDDNFLDASLDLSQIEGYQTLFVVEPFLIGKNNYQNKLKLRISSSSSIFDLASRIFTEYTQKRSGYMTFIKALFTELIVNISREFEIQHKQDPFSLMKIGKAISYMENNFVQPISLAEISRMASLSERQFIRRFKAIFQATPIEYINKLRIRYAKELLLSKNLSIKDIAYQCGFSDQNYFSRKFKEVEGMPPREYVNTIYTYNINPAKN